MALIQHNPAEGKNPLMVSCGRACELSKDLSNLSKNGKSTDAHLVLLHRFAHVLSKESVILPFHKVQLYQGLLILSRQYDTDMNGSEKPTVGFVHKMAGKDPIIGKCELAHLLSFLDK